MAVPTGHVGFTPDLGFLPFSDHFESSQNSLLVLIGLSELTVSGSTDPDEKGPNQLNITIGSTTYLIPTDIWRRFHPGRKQTIYWKDGSGNSGSFRFFAEAPGVF